VVQLQQLCECLRLWFGFDDLGEEVIEIDRPAYCVLHSFHLVTVEDVCDLPLHLVKVGSFILDCGNRQLRLLELVVNRLIEILRLARFHDHWEMVPVPLTLVSSLHTRSQSPKKTYI
jgi:hypothetical protein